MLIKRAAAIPASEITDESVFRNRRKLLLAMGGFAGLAASGPAAALTRPADPQPDIKGSPAVESRLGQVKKGPWQAKDALTPHYHVTNYNNFYEFGTGKGDPVRYAHEMKVDPWSVTVSGEAARKGTFALEDLLRGLDLEERIYRFRCVEAWSMVVPWIGFPLADLLKKFEPGAGAGYVRFKTLHDPKQMRGQRSAFSSIAWPYVEGLRMDEAMHPLTLMAVGVYGDAMPPQNGAPLRLVVPWKYGFKSIKSIVSIEFVRKQPKTTWELANSREYGFFSNVNPEVDHPRWSQKSERRLPSSIWAPNRRETLKFNGYGEDVAGLYTGMDLRRHF